MSGGEFDVVIAGAGGAGLSAALTAAEAGLEVLLLDHDPNFRRGCNTYMSTAMVPAAGTRWQHAAGVSDSPEIFYQDIRAKTKGTVYEALARRLTKVGPDLVDWLADAQGVPLELATDFSYPGHSRHRCHTVPDRSGRTLHSHLVSRAEGHNSITIAVPISLRAVHLNSAGALSGATIANPDGSTETISTAAVILATSGFAGNPKLVRKHIAEIADAIYFGSDAVRGDGLRIGMEIGADTGYLDAYQGHGSLATPHGVLVTWATVMHGGVILNINGRRFADETIGYSEYAREVLRQPERVAWVILDERIAQLCRPFADFVDLLSQDAMLWCPNETVLARTTGVPEASLTATLREASACAAGGRDHLGRRFWESELKPPYGAVKVTGALFHTQGGLLVDENGSVLRDGSPVPGLYAAGGAAVGISGHGADGYLAGNGLLGALGLGYIAGRDASHVKPDSRR